MANTISYGETVIKTITEAGTFTLPTAGKLMTDNIVLHLDSDHKFRVKMSWGGRAQLYTRSLTRTLHCAGLYMTDDITVEVEDLNDVTDVTVIVYTGASNTPIVYHTSSQITLAHDTITDKVFSHWMCNGAMLSNQATLRFQPDNDTAPHPDDYVIQAIFDDDTTTPSGRSTVLTSMYLTDDQKGIFYVANIIPDNSIAVRWGLIASPATSYDPSIEDLTESNAAYVKTASTAGITASYYTWSKSKVSTGDVWYVRGYMVWSTNGIEQPEVYSPMIKFVAGS